MRRATNHDCEVLMKQRSRRPPSVAPPAAPGTSGPGPMKGAPTDREAAMTAALLAVARCENLCAARCRGGHACHAIVGAQPRSGRGKFQLPEPWRGDILNAPLLFVSSNPGLSDNDDSPRREMSDEEIVEYYLNRSFPEDFPRNLDRKGEKKTRAVRFWSEIRARAAELYGPDHTDIHPGRDFALTEVVHCKSRGEAGVKAARATCTLLHFERIAHLSSARVVVVLGAQATDALAIPRWPWLCEMPWFGRQRWVLSLPHPNARQLRSVSRLYDAASVEHIQEILRG